MAKSKVTFHGVTIRKGAGKFTISLGGQAYNWNALSKDESKALYRTFMNFVRDTYPMKPLAVVGGV